MKTIQEWFDEYSESHQDPTNKLMHWVCVPTICFSIIGILANFSVLLAALVFILALIFYARLDVVLAIAMAALTLVMAWIGQFYGHKVEGKKPSFFKDLQFLLIGPIWCLDAYLGKVSAKLETHHKTQMTSI